MKKSIYIQQIISKLTSKIKYIHRPYDETLRQIKTLQNEIYKTIYISISISSASNVTRNEKLTSGGNFIMIIK